MSGAVLPWPKIRLGAPLIRGQHRRIEPRSPDYEAQAARWTCRAGPPRNSGYGAEGPIGQEQPNTLRQTEDAAVQFDQLPVNQYRTEGVFNVPTSPVADLDAQPTIERCDDNVDRRRVRPDFGGIREPHVWLISFASVD